MERAAEILTWIVLGLFVLYVGHAVLEFNDILVLRR